MYIKKIEEKVPGKVGECIFDSLKCKSFQGPKAGPGLWTMLYSPLRLPLFASLRLQNLGKNFRAPPLDQILDPLLLYGRVRSMEKKNKTKSNRLIPHRVNINLSFNVGEPLSTHIISTVTCK